MFMTRLPERSFPNLLDFSTACRPHCLKCGRWLRRAIRAILGSNLWPLGLPTLLGLMLGWPQSICGAATPGSAQTLAVSEDLESQKLWHALIAQADALGLPSRFLK